MSELEFVLEDAVRADGFGGPSMHHLASPLALREYVRIAEDTRQAVRGKRLLDWGCGYGQLSYLLKRRGLDVTSYDVGPTIEESRLSRTGRITAVRGGHASWLPFRDRAFDAVLACGVLEHVADVRQSLEEIRRVLGPGGRLLVFNLPQRWSYKELLIERLKLGYTHERKFTPASIRTALEEHGFRVVSVHRAGVVPHLATGLPPRARSIYYRASGSLFAADRILSKTPPLNRIAQSLELVAERASG